MKDGRFVAVGSNEEAKAVAGKRTEIIDAAGMTVVPGFIDCHNHAPGEMLLYDVLVGNPYEVEFVAIESIVAKLRERAAKTQPGFWVERASQLRPSKRLSARLFAQSRDRE